MTSPKLLIPVRIPELGPALGKLLTGTGRVPPDPTRERQRSAMLGRLIEATGEARRLAAEGARTEAVRTLGLDVWLDSWEQAVNGIARELVSRVNDRLEAEARAVRMPRRLRRRVLLDAAEVRGLTGRLGVAGAALVPALDHLQAQGVRLLAATTTDREALDEWQQALLTAARRLEAAWLALEEQVDEETRRWREAEALVAAWRRPLWPVAVAGVPAVAAAAWLGAVLGGYLPSPTWLSRVWDLLP
ncbi:MAG: hypothetical protein OEY20_01810 [Gemmatimonadota bacterium]|nr:hypothetical protein [Gemmatimonadota bacterium]MDH4350836.1 hypothetical protein [Gemmatimonadota bacterium]MDH5195968.1 hypothetical protein [Gemmatimonadota bacterium]